MTRVWVGVKVKSIKTFKPTKIDFETLLWNHLHVGVNISLTCCTRSGSHILFHAFPINGESSLPMRILIFPNLWTILITGDQNWWIQTFHFFFRNIIVGVVKQINRLSTNISSQCLKQICYSATHSSFILLKFCQCPLIKNIKISKL